MLRSLTVGLLSAGVLLVVAVFPVQAQSTTLSDDQLQYIRANCLPIKNTLKQLHATDALLRVNRGQQYESMTTKLMERLGTRLVANGLTVAPLSDGLTEYNKTLAKFRTTYQSYEEQLASTLRIDCTKQPASFFQAIESARTKRTAVHDAVLDLHKAIDTYRAAFNAFRESFRQVSKDE
ncbi:MAG: exported protein of unknown function [Candidatus Saccharibacteria bacterium]|nr:exported protein of unknown function [Candidatus Saccharibacteria bacterium]